MHVYKIIKKYLPWYIQNLNDHDMERKENYLHEQERRLFEIA